ncbi:MAG TPA: hypothetical protein VK633_11900, partial [Verrucomicrobiae bacterium]|nr:hypothetical protein [Verrucomicrobiae bacterium]
AAAPGAGFSETADFLKVFQQEKLQPTWWEQKLWHLYDATDYAANLYQCPTVAYSGEIDRQKQAADFMAKALDAEGLDLVHIIGPQTGHKYHPDAKLEVDRRIDSIVARGRDPMPSHIRFTTWTLRYNKMAWITVDALDEHWERARVDAEIQNRQRVVISTKNVAALTVAMPPGYSPFDKPGPMEVVLDGRTIEGPPMQSDRSWTAHFSRIDKKWQLTTNEASGLRKRHGLQGPIDDAFMDSFLFVRPTGKPLNEKVGAWVTNELQRAVKEWRRQFRGEARIKDDVDVTDADLTNSHVVLWGDPSSNRLIRRIAEGIPIRWSAEGIRTGEKLYPSENCVPVLIYPNPLNPQRYVVLNSGFTFREYDYLNNARQTPKLPDFAIVDIDTPPSSRAPGAISEAGFFNEKWELVKGRQAANRP